MKRNDITIVAACGLVLVLGFAGCGREQPKVYQAPAEKALVQSEVKPSAQMPAGMNAGQLPSGHPPMERVLPQWEVPAGWQVQPPTSSFVAASFKVAGEQEAQATVTFSTLNGDGGGALPNVNRWRGQLGLEPIAASDLPNQTQTLECGGQPATLVDIKGTDGRTGQPARMLVAMQARGAETWFYKFLGNEALIEREKDAFLGWVKSVKGAHE